MKQVYKALYAFLSAICLLLLGNLFVLITKDDWPLFKIPDIVLMVAFFLTILFGFKLSHHFGKLDERHRPRKRIESTYQTEPHGIRYTRKAR